MHYPGKVSTKELEWDRVDWVRISTHVECRYTWTWIWLELDL